MSSGQGSLRSLAGSIASRDANYGQLIVDAGIVLEAAERRESALIEIAAVLALPIDAETKLERVRHRVAEGLNDG